MTRIQEKLLRGLLKCMALVDAFVRWWWFELLQVMPQRLKNLIAKGRDKYWIEQKGSVLDIYAINGDGPDCRAPLRSVQMSHIERLDVPDGAEAYISVDKDSVLIDCFTLPLAAEAHLGQALKFEACRRLPADAQNFIIRHLVLTKEKEPKLLHIEWAVVSKERVLQLEDTAKRLGFTSLTTGIACENNVGFSYVFSAPHFSLYRLGKRGKAILLTLLSFAMLLAFYSYKLNVDLKAINAEIESIQGAAKNAIMDKQKSERFMDALLRFDIIRTEVGVLDVLSALTIAMPDDTWVEDFSYKDGSVRVVGYSASASQIVERLSATDLFSYSKFEAPLTPVPSVTSGANIERFDVSFKVKTRKAEGGSK